MNDLVLRGVFIVLLALAVPISAMLWCGRHWDSPTIPRPDIDLKK